MSTELRSSGARIGDADGDLNKCDGNADGDLNKCDGGGFGDRIPGDGESVGDMGESVSNFAGEAPMG